MSCRVTILDFLGRKVGCMRSLSVSEDSFVVTVGSARATIVTML